MQFKKLCISLFFLILLATSNQLLVTRVFASESDFSTRYDTTYDVTSDGSTLVTEKITLKNLTSQYYVSNFSLTIGSTTLYDVSASDQQGAMEVKTDANGQKTTITINFNAQIAGAGKEQFFTLRFKSKDFAQSLGKTWEVNLPKIPGSTNIDSYNLTLSVPVAFGDPTSISPHPKSESQAYDKLFFTFDKSQLEKSGISVNFGNIQYFDFSIKYPLKNRSLFPVVTSITLPPDTEYQDINISRIEPKPVNVTIDDDGNYLAWYRLPRGTIEEIMVTGSAKLYIKKKLKDQSTISADKLTVLTKSQRYWESDNPSIKETLSSIFKDNPTNNTAQKAELIYRYVVNTLKYSTKRLNDNDIQRLGAITALNNPDSAVCMEFTDLFIALARAAGIPARELDGFAYSANQNLRPLSLARDLLHAWPEFYDPDLGWVMVDPTWENTSGGVDYFNKFDLNHLALSIKGVSSEYPTISDDVKVSLSKVEFTAKSELNLSIETPDSIWAGFPVKIAVRVLNQGPSIQAPINLTILTQKLTIQGANTVNLDAIPAFGQTTLQFNLKTPLVWQSFEDTITVVVDGQIISKQIQIKPFFQTIEVQYVAGGLAFLLVGTYAGTLGLHWYQKRRLSGRRRS